MTVSTRLDRTVSRIAASRQDRVGVLAVDGQAFFLDVARDVVAATPGFRWVGGATSGEEALDVVAERGPELVLIDVRMPGMDGIEAAHRICESHPDLLVVLISVEASPAITPAIEASGAATLVRMQEFGPAGLRRLWRTYRKQNV